MAEDQLSTAATEVNGAVGALARRLRSEPQAHEVSSVGLTVLGRLYRDGPLTMPELSEVERVPTQSLTRLLGTLSGLGLIARYADPQDTRRTYLRVTAQGQLLLREDAERREAWLRAALTTLSGAELGTLHEAVAILHRLAER